FLFFSPCSAYAVRRVNDILMMAERVFIDTAMGLPNRKDYRHLVMAPSAIDKYSGTKLAGIGDLLTVLKGTKGMREKSEPIFQQFLQHLSAVTFHVGAAAQLLRQCF